MENSSDLQEADYATTTYYGGIMRKGLMTTVQESKGKFTTPIPMGLVGLLGIQKGDKFNWTLREGGIQIQVVKS